MLSAPGFAFTGGGAKRGGDGSAESFAAGETAEENRGTEEAEAMERTRKGQQVKANCKSKFFVPLCLLF